MVKSIEYIQIGEPPVYDKLRMTVTSYPVTAGNKCEVCGESAINVYYENGVCVAMRCENHPYGVFRSEGFHSREAYYLYKCPDCHGEFNAPAADYLLRTGTYFPKMCPFCGREMKGL